MDNEIDKKMEFKEKIIPFLKENKKKFTFLVFSALCITSLLVISNIFESNKNDKISEKYIRAGVYLSSNNKLDSKKLYEEIILSKNKFYSILALNTIIEKNLVEDKNKILEYFKFLENLKLDKSQRDLIILKKALYLIKTLEVEAGEKLLKKLIDTDSDIKLLAKEVLSN